MTNYEKRNATELVERHDDFFLHRFTQPMPPSGEFATAWCGRSGYMADDRETGEKGKKWRRCTECLALDQLDAELADAKGGL